MKVGEYIAEVIKRIGITDVFGIPGGVILELIYAFERHGINVHLNYNEQCAGFAAYGYARSSSNIGLAFTTKGPGFTNIITSIADAYYDSIPVIFITSHSVPLNNSCGRLCEDQEMDTCKMVSDITKYSRKVDSVESLKDVLSEALRTALSDRPGPVFIDILSTLFKQEINEDVEDLDHSDLNKHPKAKLPIKEIEEALSRASSPVLLIGDGVNISGQESNIRDLIDRLEIPVLSSRYSHNFADLNLYFGYIGSHGIRYANAILEKSDLMLCIGNSLKFSNNSLSFNRVLDCQNVFQIDVDESVLARHQHVDIKFRCDLGHVIQELLNTNFSIEPKTDWINECNSIRNSLWEADLSETAAKIESLLSKVDDDFTLVADVGNNEFWLSRASVHAQKSNRVIYSKSFGALGCALGKAIGAYYGNHKPVVVVVGDQGLQLNIQELQFIGQHKLPIIILLINNQASGMIRDREDSMNFNHHLLTTNDSGYGNPDFEKLSEAYSINYVKYESFHGGKFAELPLLVDVEIDEDIALRPYLPKGNSMLEMMPRLQNNNRRDKIDNGL